MLKSILGLFVAATLTGGVTGATAPALYPMTTVVIETDDKNDVVTCVDFNGNEWAFDGVEDWAVGDIASMIMCDNGTDEIYDDIICDVRYSGWICGSFGSNVFCDYPIANFEK